LSQGTPMLRAGDEIAQSQGGNNNAYCQDNATSWIDWALGDAADLAFCQRLTALRAGLGALRQRDFLHGEETAEGYPNAAWQGLDGAPTPWEITERAGLALLLRPAGEAWVLIAINPGEAASLALPEAPGRAWERALDTGRPEAAPAPAGPAPELSPQSVAVFVAREAHP
ncbi:MAG: glycogen debranching enzyme GlgX, partial [Pseudomonadota bacterium]